MTHTSSRCWGAIWGLLAVASLGVAFYFNLLIAKNDSPPLGSLSDASRSTKLALYVAIFLVGFSIVHTAITRRCMIRTMKARRAAHHGEFASAV